MPAVFNPGAQYGPPRQVELKGVANSPVFEYNFSVNRNCVSTEQLMVKIDPISIGSMVIVSELFLRMLPSVAVRSDVTMTSALKERSKILTLAQFSH